MKKSLLHNVLSSHINVVIKTTAIFLSLFIILSATACFSNNTVPDSIKSMRDVFSQEKYIIHACGEISDMKGNIYDYTNSKEALENALEKGNKLIEVDFHYTNDKELVCGHAWGDLYLNGKQITPGEAPSLADFLQSKVQNIFTVLTFDDIAEYMKKNENMIVITDTKETDLQTYKMIAEKYPDLLDRFVVQIYHASEYDSVKKEGFNNIIYTLYEATPEELTKVSLIKASKKPLIGFTFHKDLADDEDFMNTMKGLNTPLFVHTVNDDEEIQKYLNNGISCIYTDITDKTDNF